MKTTLFFSLLLCLLYSCNNTPQEDEDEQNDVELNSSSVIVNKKTAGHLQIDGTHLSMLVPSGFTYEQKIFGYRKDALHLIQSSEIQNLNFNNDYATINQKNFEKNYPENNVKEFVKFKLNGYNAVFIHYVKKELIDYYELLFGDETFYCTVIGTSSLIKKDISKDIRNCILSVYYDKNLSVEEKEYATFNVAENKSEFKKCQDLPNFQIFSIDGKPIKSGDPSIYMCHFMYDKLQSVQIVSQSNIETLTENNFIPNSKKIDKVTFINTIDDYVYLTPGKMNGEDVTCIQLYNTEGNRCVVSISFMIGNYSNVLAEMKILSKATQFLQLN